MSLDDVRRAVDRVHTPPYNLSLICEGTSLKGRGEVEFIGNIDGYSDTAWSRIINKDPKMVFAKT